MEDAGRSRGLTMGGAATGTLRSISVPVARRSAAQVSKSFPPPLCPQWSKTNWHPGSSRVVSTIAGRCDGLQPHSQCRPAAARARSPSR